MKALSLTQPWAWLVAHGWKDVENRTWSTKLRGEFLIHASKKMTRANYHDVVSWLIEHDERPAFLALPAFENLELGGIVGIAELVDVLAPRERPSRRWHMPGQYGFVLRGGSPLPFVPCSGALSFWGEWDLTDGGRAVRRAA